MDEKLIFTMTPEVREAMQKASINKQEKYTELEDRVAMKKIMRKIQDL